MTNKIIGPPTPPPPESTLPTTTREKLEALANALLDDALTVKMDTKEKVEIFKPVSLWYLGIQKAKKGDAPPEEGGTFDDIIKRVNGKEVRQ